MYSFSAYIQKVNILFLKTNLLFVFSSEAMEERYEHKTHARIQEVVRIY